MRSLLLKPTKACALMARPALPRSSTPLATCLHRWAHTRAERRARRVQAGVAPGANSKAPASAVESPLSRRSTGPRGQRRQQRRPKGSGHVGHRTRASVARYLRSLALSGQVDIAERVFTEEKEKGNLVADVYVFHQLMLAAINGHQLRRTIRVYNKMKKFGLKPDVRTFGLLARAVASAKGKGLLDRLTWVRDEMQRHEVVANARVYAHLMRATAVHGPQEDAAECWRLVQEVYMEAEAMGVKLEVAAWGTMWESACRAGDTVWIRQAWKNMRAAAIAPDTQTYNTFMHSVVFLLPDPDVDLLMELINDMDKLRVALDHRTMDILLRAAKVTSSKPLAERVLKHLTHPPSWSSVRVDLPLLRALVRVLPKDAAVGEFVLKEVSRLRSTRLPRQVRTFEALIDIYGRIRQPQDAFAAYEEMKSLMLEPGSVTLSIVLSACEVNQMPAKAVRLVAEFEFRYGIVANDVHANILSRIFRGRDTEAMWRTQADALVEQYKAESEQGSVRRE